jgi:hypothetical protein
MARLWRGGPLRRWKGWIAQKRAAEHAGRSMRYPTAATFGTTALSPGVAGAVQGRQCFFCCWLATACHGLPRVLLTVAMAQVLSCGTSPAAELLLVLSCGILLARYDCWGIEFPRSSPRLLTPCPHSCCLLPACCSYQGQLMTSNASLGYQQCALLYQELVTPSFGLPPALLAHGPDVPFVGGAPLVVGAEAVLEGYQQLVGRGAVPFGASACDVEQGVVDAVLCVLNVTSVEAMGDWCQDVGACSAFVPWRGEPPQLLGRAGLAAAERVVDCASALQHAVVGDSWQCSKTHACRRHCHRRFSPAPTCHADLPAACLPACLLCCRQRLCQLAAAGSV